MNHRRWTLLRVNDGFNESIFLLESFRPKTFDELRSCKNYRKTFYLEQSGGLCELTCTAVQLLTLRTFHDLFIRFYCINPLKTGLKKNFKLLKTWKKGRQTLQPNKKAWVKKKIIALINVREHKNSWICPRKWKLFLDELEKNEVAHKRKKNIYFSSFFARKYLIKKQQLHFYSWFKKN